MPPACYRCGGTPKGASDAGRDPSATRSNQTRNLKGVLVNRNPNVEDRGRRELTVRMPRDLHEQLKRRSDDQLESEALAILNSSNPLSPGHGITALFVVDAATPIGIIHLHDLLRAGVA